MIITTIYIYIYISHLTKLIDTFLYGNMIFDRVNRKILLCCTFIKILKLTRFFFERLFVMAGCAAAKADEIFKSLEHLICRSSCVPMRETRARILARCILDKLVVSLDYKSSISLSEI